MLERMLPRMRIRPYLLALISTVALLSVSAFSTMAHQGDRVMKKRTAPNEPIELTEVRADGKLVSFEQAFDAPADNWAETVTVVARNISNKTITATNIIIAFPTGPRSQVAFTLRYHGEAPPNTEINLSCAPQYYKLMPFLAQRGETPNFSQASLIIDQVFFSDDTLWAQGTVFRKNATTGQWDVVSTPSRNTRTMKHHALLKLPNKGGLALARPIETCISVRQQTRV